VSAARATCHQEGRHHSVCPHKCRALQVAAVPHHATDLQTPSKKRQSWPDQHVQSILLNKDTDSPTLSHLTHCAGPPTTVTVGIDQCRPACHPNKAVAVPHFFPCSFLPLHTHRHHQTPFKISVQSFKDVPSQQLANLAPVSTQCGPPCKNTNCSCACCITLKTPVGCAIALHRKPQQGVGDSNRQQC
jgi:hypothetical protein